MANHKKENFLIVFSTAVVTIVAIVLIVSFLTLSDLMVFHSVETQDEIIEGFFDDGYEEGLQEGEDLGHSEGYREGRQEGYNIGYREIPTMEVIRINRVRYPIDSEANPEEYWDCDIYNWEITPNGVRFGCRGIAGGYFIFQPFQPIP